MSDKDKPANRIRWEQAATGGGKVGYIGPSQNAISVAYIGWGVVRNADKPWVLQTKFPGYTKSRNAASMEDAQALAERILINFVRLVGAKFPKDYAK